MLDLTVPYYPVIMINRSPGHFQAALPSGYQLLPWSPGREGDWSAIQCAANSAAPEKMDAVFQGEFASRPDLLRRRLLLAYSPDGTPAATAALWQGEDLGTDMPRLHWVATAPREQGRGLCKALLAALLELYHAEGCTGGIYLTTQTTSWRAIGIYERFGFVPELEHTLPGRQWDNEAAWRIIREELAGG